MSSFVVYWDSYIDGEPVYYGVPSNPLGFVFGDMSSNWSYFDQITNGSEENEVFHQKATLYPFYTSATMNGRRVVLGYDKLIKQSDTDITREVMWTDGYKRYRYSHRYIKSWVPWNYEITYEECEYVITGSYLYFSGDYWHYQGYEDLESFVLSKPEALRSATSSSYRIRGIADGDCKAPSANFPAIALELERKHHQSAGRLYNLQVDMMKSTALDCNNLDNVRMLAGLLGKLVKDGPTGLVSDFTQLKDKSVLKKATSAWLGYRYSYTTTKMDLEEILDYIDKQPNFENGWLVLRGGQSLPGGNLHCKITYRDALTSGFGEVTQAIRDLGFAPTLENLWDMVPFSFVVDWFLRIGDIFSALSDSYYVSSRYDFKSFVHSWSWHELHTMTDGIVDFSSYSRTVDSSPAPFWFPMESRTSQKTVIMRIFDGLSLITQ